MERSYVMRGRGRVRRSSTSTPLALHQTGLELLGHDVGVEGGVVESEVRGAFPRRAGVVLLRRVLCRLPPLVQLTGHRDQTVEAHVDLVQTSLGLVRSGALARG